MHFSRKIVLISYAIYFRCLTNCLPKTSATQAAQQQQGASSLTPAASAASLMHYATSSVLLGSLLKDVDAVRLSTDDQVAFYDFCNAKAPNLVSHLLSSVHCRLVCGDHTTTVAEAQGKEPGRKYAQQG